MGMHRFCRFIPFVSILTLCSCATQDNKPLLVDPERNPHVIEAAGKPTQIRLKVTSPVKWDRAKRGAREGVNSCANMRVSGGKEALRQLLFCLPVGGLIGAIQGALQQPAPRVARVDDLEFYLGKNRIKDLINRHTALEASQAGVELAHASDHTNGTKKMEPQQAIEIWLKTIRLDVYATGRAKQVKLGFDFQVRLLDFRSGKTLQMINLQLDSPTRRYEYWLDQSYTQVETFAIQSAAEIASHIKHYH